MKTCFIAVDGGTSNTRIRLAEEGKILREIKIPIGAASGHGENGKQLEKALQEGIARLLKDTDVQVECILASGMMTSDSGLISLPRQQGPFQPEKLTLKPVYFREIHAAPFYFISGVQFYDPENFKAADLIKGEETEVYGILAEADYQRDVLVIHYGSHNKALYMKKGCIERSITTLGGELLSAVMQYTILKQSVPNFSEFIMDEKSVHLGYETVQESGLVRGLFLARAAQVLYGKSPNEVLSFLYGGLTFEDLQAFAPLLREKKDRIVLYGREQFIQAFQFCRERIPEAAGDRIQILDFEESERLSVKGLYSIYQHAVKTGGHQ